MNPETLGKIVHDTWVAWAQQQPDAELNWLGSWDELDEGRKAVSYQIGEAVSQYVCHSIQEQFPPIEDEEPVDVESPATAIQRAFELHQVKVEASDVDCMLLDGINALLKQQSDRIIGALKEHERRLGCHYSSEPADRLRSILRDYEERAARATQLLADMRSDTLTYLRAISLMIDSAGNAGTHREKDATLRAVIRLMESAIAKLRDSLKRFGSNWHNPDIFASDYPVMDYIKRIRELEAENKQLKGEADTPLTPFDEIRF